MSTECGACGRSLGDGTTLCMDDTADLAAQLRAVDDLVDDLDVTFSRQDQLIGPWGGVGTAREKPLPFKVDAPEAAYLVSSTLTAWAREIASTYTPSVYRTVDPHDPTRLPNSLSIAGLAARVLLDGLDALRRRQDAGQAYDEIVAALREGRRVVDRPVERRYIGTCQGSHEDTECSADLYAPVNADTMVCQRCGIRWDVAHLRAALAERAPNETGTTTIIAGYLRTVGIDVSAQAVRRWARPENGRPPRLHPAGHDNWGRPLYRLGDALDVYARRERTGKAAV